MKTDLSLAEVAALAPKLMSQELRMLLVLSERGPMRLGEVAAVAGLSLIRVRRSGRTFAAVGRDHAGD